MSTTLRHPEDLIAAGLAPPQDLDALAAVAERFAVAVTPEMAALAAGPEGEAIARQFVPDVAELDVAAEERVDPIGDGRWSPLPGIVHRYPDRVLLKASHVCPVYCRFCFRREQVGPRGKTLSATELGAALDYVRERPEIWEVILSGGDPFLLSARRIAEIVRALDAIPHLGVIRFHTRVPIVDPARVGGALVAALAAEKAVYVAVHANHPREFTDRARAAIRRLARAGLGLLGQSVLLRGINDDVGTLTALFRSMVANRIKPYYLHHADLAHGTGHFRTDLAAGQALLRALRGRVSGLCQPTYMLDIPDGFGKVPVGPSYLRAGSRAGEWEVEDPCGRRHPYPPAPNGTDEPL